MLSNFQFAIVVAIEVTILLTAVFVATKPNFIYWLAVKYHFNKYNKICFNGMLKPIRIIVHKDLIDRRDVGRSDEIVTLGEFGSLKDDAKYIMISVSPRNPDWRGSLLHEMCHYLQFSAAVSNKTLFAYSAMPHHSDSFNSLLKEAKSKARLK